VRAIAPLPSRIFIVHGEEKQALSLAAAIQTEHPKIEVQVPNLGSTHET
jgi:metallo-beta-lactamase family protein